MIRIRSRPQRMHAAENELLTELGIGPVYGATGQ